MWNKADEYKKQQYRDKSNKIVSKWYSNKIIWLLIYSKNKKIKNNKEIKRIGSEKILKRKLNKLMDIHCFVDNN